MRPFALARPADLAEALALIAAGAVPLAGGTDLLGLMKAGVAAPERLVDLGRIAALRGWRREPDGGLSIGALTPLAELEGSADLARELPIVVEALRDAATPQLRTMGTVGGNLLQRTRCWYFRDDAFDCWLKGGARCFAREGENAIHAVIGARECVSVSPSDLAPALVACDATVVIRSATAEREVALADLLVAPHGDERREQAIEPGELVVAVRVPAAAFTRRGTYRKQMDRKAWSFALVSVAAAARVESGRASDVRIVLGGVAPVPWRDRAAEAALEGQPIDEASCARAADAALAGAEPLAGNGHKVPLAREALRRALLSLVS